ncbi:MULTISPECIES: hypothetical protein [Streptomyces]|uniref:hypothetical protein n=1 Tax=Streptomyces TaxID=1883 RepID=UPI00344B10DD
MSDHLFHTHPALQASALRREELIRRANEHRLARRARRAARQAAKDEEGRVTGAVRFTVAA